MNEKYRNTQFLLSSGKAVSGVVVKETEAEYHVVPNLLAPDAITVVSKQDVDEQTSARLSPMPIGLVNTLNKQEIIDLVCFLQAGGYEPPAHLKHHHNHKQ